MYQIVKAIDKEKTEIKNIKKLVMELKVLTSVSNIHFYTPNREKEFQTNLEQNKWFLAYDRIIRNYENQSKITSMNCLFISNMSHLKRKK